MSIEIKRNGKVLKTVEESSDFDEQMQLTEEDMSLVSESINSKDTKRNINNVLRVVNHAEYINNVSVHEYNIDSDGYCKYPADGHLDFLNPKVTITKDKIKVVTDDKSVNFNIDEIDTAYMYGGNSFSGIDEEGNQLTNFSIELSKLKDNKRTNICIDITVKKATFKL